MPMEIEEVRRQNLILLVNKADGQRKLSDVCGGKPTPAQISQWLNRSPDSKTGRPRVIHSNSARGIEERLRLEKGWMDQQRHVETHANQLPDLLGSSSDAAPGYVRFQHLDVNAGAGPGMINDDFPAIVRLLELREEEALALAGRRQNGSIYVAGIASDSMVPTLNPKDLVFIDSSICHFDGDGIYFFVYEDTLFCKRLQRMPRGRIAVISDNPRYKEWAIDPEDQTPWRIVARVLSALPLKVSALA